MQSRFLIILLVFCGLTLTSRTQAQTSSYRLETADSLFRTKRYTQAFEHYQAILKNNEYTPSMLLKMAFVQEALGHLGQALYYLNLYYLASNDPSALRKMEDLASVHNLNGYEATDTDRLLTWYYNYHSYISMVLVAFGVFMLAVAFYIRFRRGLRPVVSFIFIVLTALLLFAHLNVGEKISIGVIAGSNTYIMNGPSSGADVVDIVKEGHRIEIVGRNDVWLMVRWNGSTAYIKENGVLPVRL